MFVLQAENSSLQGCYDYITSKFTVSPTCSFFAAHFHSSLLLYLAGQFYFFFSSFLIFEMVAWTQCQWNVLWGCRIKEKTLGATSVFFSLLKNNCGTSQKPKWYGMSVNWQKHSKQVFLLKTHYFPLCFSLWMLKFLLSSKADVNCLWKILSNLSGFYLSFFPPCRWIHREKTASLSAGNYGMRFFSNVKKSLALVVILPSNNRKSSWRQLFLSPRGSLNKIKKDIWSCIFRIKWCLLWNVENLEPLKRKHKYWLSRWYITIIFCINPQYKSCCF